MARTIEEIQNTMVSDLQSRIGQKLSVSKFAEWRLWTYVVAVTLHAFELIHDLFRSEMEVLTNKITPGTVRWYAEMCYRFQNGHKLLFDEKTAMLYYAEDAPDARIVKIVAITEKENYSPLVTEETGNVLEKKNSLLIKAAKLDRNGKIEPLTLEEKYNFTAYIDAIKFAGVNTDVVSTTEDRIRYDLQVWFDPAIPHSLVEENVRKALEDFKSSLGFDSMIYTQKLVDAVLEATGVVTCRLKSLGCKGASDNEFKVVDVFAELESGYFEYATDSVLELTSIKELR